MLTVVSCSLVGVLYNAMVAWSPGVWLQCTHCTGGTNSSVQTLGQRRPPGSPPVIICELWWVREFYSRIYLNTPGEESWLASDDHLSSSGSDRPTAQPGVALFYWGVLTVQSGGGVVQQQEREREREREKKHYFVIL